MKNLHAVDPRALAGAQKEIKWNMEPLHDVVLIRPYRQIVSIGGILIPRDADNFHEDMGEIVSAGPGQLNDEGKLLPMFVKAGDMVMFSTHGHQVTKVDGEELIVLRQNSILFVMTPKRIVT
jgi:chaperonin GroES